LFPERSQEIHFLYVLLWLSQSSQKFDLLSRRGGNSVWGNSWEKCFTYFEKNDVRSMITFSSSLTEHEGNSGKFAALEFTPQKSEKIGASKFSRNYFVTCFYVILVLCYDFSFLLLILIKLLWVELICVTVSSAVINYIIYIK